MCSRIPRFTFARLGRAAVSSKANKHVRPLLCQPEPQPAVQHRSLSTVTPSIETQKHVIETSDLPSKETLLRMDWLLEHQAPGFLKSRLKPFFDACINEVVFEDNIYKYNIRSKNALLAHIAKIRLYFRYMSPFNKVERIGSCVYEGEDVVVILWRLSTLESSLMSYLPAFLTKKEPKVNESEGALDVHINKDGYITKIVNRKITAADREGAKVMEEFKKDAEETRRKEAEKELRRAADATVGE